MATSSSCTKLRIARFKFSAFDREVCALYTTTERPAGHLRFWSATSAFSSAGMSCGVLYTRHTRTSAGYFRLWTICSIVSTMICRSFGR